MKKNLYIGSMRRVNGGEDLSINLRVNVSEDGYRSLTLWYFISRFEETHKIENIKRKAQEAIESISDYECLGDIDGIYKLIYRFVRKMREFGLEPDQNVSNIDEYAGAVELEDTIAEVDEATEVVKTEGNPFADESKFYEVKANMEKVYTVGQCRFNYEFGLYLAKEGKKKSIYQIMLKANELWSYGPGKGMYPKEDKQWIQDLCRELLLIVEDKAWKQFPPESKEAQDLLAYMNICELTAKKVA